MNKTLTLLTAMILLLVLGSAWAAGPGTPDLPCDEWHAIFLKGKRVGLLRVQMAREGDGVVTRTDMKMTVQRFQSEITIAMGSLFREQLDGTPVAFETSISTGEMQVQTKGTMQGGQCQLVTTQGEQSQEQTVTWNPKTLFPYAFRRQMKALSLKPGATFTADVFHPLFSANKPMRVTVKGVGPENVDVLGVVHEGVKINTAVSGSSNILQSLWVDAAGTTLVFQTPVMGIRFIPCTKEYALAETESLEIGESMVIRPDRPIQSPEQLTKLVVMLSTKDGSPLSIKLPSYGSQRCIKQDQTSLTLEISSEPMKTKEADLAPYTAATTFLNSEDERIVAAARQAVGQETDPWQQARALRRAVYALITKKNFGVAMATASEVIENREGDCSEHAVLLAAMARASGIPSRVAVGLISIEGVFVYHMWAQVYVDGAWHDLDAVLPKHDFHPAHIRLTTSAMGDDDYLMDITAFASVIGNIQITIVEQE